MRYSTVFAIVFAVNPIFPSFAQSRAAGEEQLKAMIEFAIAASFHDDVIRSIQDQCPKYQSKVGFNDRFVSEAKKLNTEIGKLLDQITQGAKPLAKAHATQIIANADGCDTEDFKKSVAATEEHQAMLTLRAMQGRFK